MCSFLWPGYSDELIFFADTCDVYFLLVDRQGAHLTVIVSLHAPCYVGTWLANIIWYIT